MSKGYAIGGPSSKHVKRIFGMINQSYEGPKVASNTGASMAPKPAVSTTISEAPPASVGFEVDNTTDAWEVVNRSSLSGHDHMGDWEREDGENIKIVRADGEIMVIGFERNEDNEQDGFTYSLYSGETELYDMEELSGGGDAAPSPQEAAEKMFAEIEGWLDDSRFTGQM